MTRITLVFITRITLVFMTHITLVFIAHITLVFMTSVRNYNITQNSVYTRLHETQDFESDKPCIKDTVGYHLKNVILNTRKSR